MSGAIDSDSSVAALRRTTCCGCGGPLPKQGQLNLVLLDKRADWGGDRMVWTNVLAPRSGTRAVAVECDYCLRNGTAPKTAVELRPDGSIIHHAVDSLVDLPELAEPEV